MEKPITFYVSKIESSTGINFCLKTSEFPSAYYLLPSDCSKKSLEEIRYLTQRILSEIPSKRKNKQIRLIFNTEFQVRGTAVYIPEFGSDFRWLANNSVELITPLSEEEIRFFYKVMQDVASTCTCEEMEKTISAFVKKIS